MSGTEYPDQLGEVTNLEDYNLFAISKTSGHEKQIALENLNNKPSIPLVVLSSGQSNSVGIYADDDDSNVAPFRSNANVYTFDTTGGNVWGQDADYNEAPWTETTPHGNEAKANIGYAFARRLQEESKKTVYHAHYAIGGRSIEEWVSTVATPMWDGMEAKIEAALATTELTSAGKSTVDVFVWSQGEEDFNHEYGPGDTFPLVDVSSPNFTNNDEIYRTYYANLELLYAKLKAEPWWGDETIWLITGGSDLHSRYSPKLAMQDFAEKHPAVVFVSGEGLTTREDPPNNDFTHFDGPSLDILGHKLCWRGYQRAFTAGLLGSQSLFTNRIGEPFQRQGDTGNDELHAPEGVELVADLKYIVTPRSNNLTIDAAGDITVTGGVHAVFNENGDPTDTLVRILGGKSGQRIALTPADNGQMFTLQHAASGADTIHCPGDVNITTEDTRSFCELYKDDRSGQWIVTNANF